MRFLTYDLFTETFSLVWTFFEVNNELIVCSLSQTGEKLLFSMLELKEQSRLLSVLQSLWDNRSSYEAYPSIFSTYQNFTA